MHLALWYVVLVCHQYDVCKNYVGSVYGGLSESGHLSSHHVLANKLMNLLCVPKQHEASLHIKDSLVTETILTSPPQGGLLALTSALVTLLLEQYWKNDTQTTPARFL